MFRYFLYLCSALYIIMYMRKYVLDLRVTSVEPLSERYLLLVASNPAGKLPEMHPGQFAQLRIDESKETFLRRPISLHRVDYERNEVSSSCRKLARERHRFGRKSPVRR